MLDQVEALRWIKQNIAGKFRIFREREKTFFMERCCYFQVAHILS